MQRQQRAGSSRGPYLTPLQCRQAPALLRAPPAATSCIQRGAHLLQGRHAWRCKADNATRRYSMPAGWDAQAGQNPHIYLVACTPGRRLTAFAEAPCRSRQWPTGKPCQARLYILIGCRTARRRPMLLVRGYGYTPSPASARCAAQWRPGPRMLSAPQSPSQRWSL